MGRVERALVDALGGESGAAAQSSGNNHRAGLQPISVSPLQGRQLTWLARSVGARRILEVGTLGGYSTVCLAEALPPDGYLLTVDNNPIHHTVARQNIDQAGLAGIVELALGNALDVLSQLVAVRAEPFDVFFVDADQHNNVEYFHLCLALARPGSLFLLDNVVRNGEVCDLETRNEAVRATQRCLEELRADPSLFDAVIFQNVGGKGHDGLLAVRVLGQE